MTHDTRPKTKEKEEITIQDARPEYGLDRRDFIKGSVALGIGGVLLTSFGISETVAAPSKATPGKPGAMRDLQAYVQVLESKGLLARVRTEVDLVHELAGVAKHFEGKEVVLFEKVKGYDMPVIIGLMWSRKNIGALFNVTAEELPFHIGDAVGKWLSNPSAFAPVIVSDAPAQEVRITPVDLRKLPTPVLALDDGGHFLSNSVVIAKDPDTGVHTHAIHRCMITGPDRMTFLLDMGRRLRNFYERAEKRNQPLEVTINNGGNLPFSISSAIPSRLVPQGAEKMGIASALLGEPVRLCKSTTVATEGLADAQFIIEAELLPHVREPEGPFGEVSGYYANLDNRWVMKIKAITRRRNPIVNTLLPGAEVYNYVGLTAEVAVFRSVSSKVEGVKNVYLAHSGGGFYTAIVQMDPKVQGAAREAIPLAFQAFPPLQIVTVVNSDIDIFNADDVQWAMATRFHPDRDLIIMKDQPGHELNPQVVNNRMTKIGFDCTYPVGKDEVFKRVAFKKVDLSKYKYTIRK